jgi:L-2-hydroxyglutarate oxidase LhgO
MNMHTDFLIVGAGIVGLALARELAQRYPDAQITLIEKESQVAAHASGRNSGVLHAGFYYHADSLKALLTVAGNRALTNYCLENGLPINRCGKVVVATTAAELEGLAELKRRGDRNGVALTIVDTQQLAEIEPNARTVSQALWSPTTATVNPGRVCQHIVAHLPNTVSILYNHAFKGHQAHRVITDKGRIRFNHLFNAAGLYADRVAQAFGVGEQYIMLPFKGLYLDTGQPELLRRHIYPVPNLKNPFLGVHFTITVDGHVKIGPTAIPALWRENYSWNHRFRLDEFQEILACQAWLALANRFNFRQLALEEMRKYYRPYFIGQARKLVHHMGKSDAGFIRPGIRAQLLDRHSGELVMDFLVEKAERSTHVLNAVSPAFTTAFPFAAYIVDQAAID